MTACMNGVAEGAGSCAPGRGIVGKRKRQARPAPPTLTWPLPEKRAGPPPPLQPAGTWAVAAARVRPPRTDRV
ncbi:Eif-2-Alpha Kinase Gcn2 [Manis pentadactyla]|nr:Eif-2-Alpha Kinase Gcn2 [Manis pentadactyla]